MSKAIVLVLGAVMMLASPTLAQDEPFTGHFKGYADHSIGTGAGIFVVGETYVARTVLQDLQPKPWYPWAPDMEYTAVLTVPVVYYDDSQVVWFVGFGAGAVEVWADNVTPADYASPTTFVDGILILTGAVDGMGGERYNFSGMPWGMYGTITFSGGAGIGLLETDCADALTMNDTVQWGDVAPPIPVGYEEMYLAEWKCNDDSPVGVDESTWGRLKGLYR